MPATARAFWVVEPGRGDIREDPLPAVEAGEVRVRTLFTGVSRGTESLVFLGRVPRSEWQRMRAPFQSGAFPAPVKYGYINVGVVEDGPAEWHGRTVFSLQPHQTRYVAPVEAIHVVPDEVPAGRAVLAANLETAINGLWDARPHVGDRIVVVGGGTVGGLVAWLAGRIPGCAVTLVDRLPQRAALARTIGVGFATPDAVPGDADLVVHASGAPEGLQLALRVAADEAAVVEMSWYGDRAVTLPLGEAFHARRLRLLSSQVGHIPAAQRPRWDHRRRLSLALSLLDDPALDAFISGESPFDDLPSVMARLAAAPGETLCHRIRYEAG